MLKEFLVEKLGINYGKSLSAFSTPAYDRQVGGALNPKRQMVATATCMAAKWAMGRLGGLRLRHERCCSSVSIASLAWADAIQACKLWWSRRKFEPRKGRPPPPQQMIQLGMVKARVNGWNWNDMLPAQMRAVILHRTGVRTQEPPPIFPRDEELLAALV